MEPETPSPSPVPPLVPIYTVGYNGHTHNSLVELLRAFGVQRVVDVRRFPSSSANPPFSKETLSKALPERGICYQSMAHELGGYADYMESPSFARALRNLTVLSQRLGPMALMCSEPQPQGCHRQLLCDALQVSGWRVLHLTGRGRESRAHALSPGAVLSDQGRLQYPRRSVPTPPSMQRLMQLVGSQGEPVSPREENRDPGGDKPEPGSASSSRLGVTKASQKAKTGPRQRMIDGYLVRKF
ncbi:hypothetical protein H632_c1646p1 [Helicosporidium sp. ATCC 50920]|nr:hypothetical protein H632_c1646p1 [Helicosporidium sp. ATCC 50920]|eukprot:KDD74019.1 hypothetical protein H632_c1646p1 [Helicosporidium sp. ATCC 50920]